MRSWRFSLEQILDSNSELIKLTTVFDVLSSVWISLSLVLTPKCHHIAVCLLTCESATLHYSNWVFSYVQISSPWLQLWQLKVWAPSSNSHRLGPRRLFWSQLCSVSHPSPLQPSPWAAWLQLWASPPTRSFRRPPGQRGNPRRSCWPRPHPQSLSGWRVTQSTRSLWQGGHPPRLYMLQCWSSKSWAVVSQLSWLRPRLCLMTNLSRWALLLFLNICLRMLYMLWFICIFRASEYDLCMDRDFPHLWKMAGIWKKTEFTERDEFDGVRNFMCSCLTENPYWFPYKYMCVKCRGSDDPSLLCMHMDQRTWMQPIDSVA